jgi:uncharacterized membrane protein
MRKSRFALGEFATVLGLPLSKGTRRKKSRSHQPQPQPGYSGFRSNPVLTFESLEDRLMLAADDVISVGRTVSAWTTTDIVGNELVITYSVYNQQSETVSGVLLTTTLELGVEFVGASVLPDQNGQELAWSLGTLAPFERASVEVTVTFDGAIPLQLDVGAEAFGMMNARAVSDIAPVLALRSDTIDVALLASTPDANADDPFIQAKAAQLDYDPDQIFQFLTQYIGYESYGGSLRGARGTLWSDAGNALDEANLGVALMRASGIPARYVSGTLSDPLAQELILSMFPEPYQVVGYTPTGTEVADPANDPQLLAETREHYWFQFDTGSGFQDADPSFAEATLGNTFTTADVMFAEVPDALRHKVEVKLNAEMWSAASAAFGFGDGLSTNTVLDQTFNTVDLVGRPLSIGNLVNQSAISAIIVSSRTTTYTPYVVIGDVALPPEEQPEVILGTPYQEVLTNFPFGTQALTGLLLDLSTVAPSGQTQTYERALFDRIGYAARQGFVAPNVSVDPNRPAPISSLDIHTFNILSSRQSPAAALLAQQFATERIESVAAQNDPTAVAQAETLIAYARSLLTNFAAASDTQTANFATAYSLAGYFDAPRITMFSSRIEPAADQARLLFGIDLIEDSMRAVASPGQDVQAPLGFAAVRGLYDSFLEAHSVPVLSGGTNLSSMTIVQQSIDQGIPLVIIGPNNLSLLDTLDLPADALARITTNVQNGLNVWVPTEALMIDGRPITAWLVGDPTTGEILSQGQDGGYQGMSDLAFATLVVNIIVNAALGYFVSDFLDGDPYHTLDPAAGTKAAVIGGVTGTVLPFGIGGLIGAIYVTYATSVIGPLAQLDPPVAPFLVDLNLPHPDTPGANASTDKAMPSNQTPDQVDADLETSSMVASGQLVAAWDSSTSNSFRTTSLEAAGATVMDSNGAAVGSGTVVLSSQSLIELLIAGNAHYDVNGTGNLAFYGAAGTNLGVSGEWKNYSATVSGNLSISITTDSLTLNGQTLPAGTYTITANSATLAGSGPSSSPQFSGTVSLTATSSTVKIGPATGTTTAGGNPLDLASGATLTGYNGTIAVAAGAGSMDSVTLDGTAAHILSVAGNPSAITTDQNTSQTFQFVVNTSFADTYTLSAQAPDGWTVEFDANGDATVTPKPGLQSGTFTILLTARSTANPDLVAQGEVQITLTPTSPGIDVSLDADPLYYLEYFGAQVPTAYRATIRNLGPQVDTFELTFPSVPLGFEVLHSKTTVTIPPGQTAIVGLYLNPTGQLPAPGTQVSFAVTATSTTDNLITQTQTIYFAVPEIHGVILTSTPTEVTTLPGTQIQTTMVIEARGNVPETVSFTVDAAAGLTVDGLQQVTLHPGEQTELIIALTPDVAVPLNSILTATISATFNGNEPVVLFLPVNVAAPGAVSIGRAATAARELGNPDLAARLNDLGIALTNLVQQPDNSIFRDQALNNLDSVISQMTINPDLADFVGPLTAAQAQLETASTPTEIQNAIEAIGTALDDFATIIAAIGRHDVTVQLNPTSRVAIPLTPQTFDVVLHNIGSQTTSYNLSIGGLPADVDSQISNSTITLAPNEIRTITVTLTQTSATNLAAFGFRVDAAFTDGVTITRSAHGSVTPRNEVVSVVDVVVNPPFGDPGELVSISTRLLNSVNQEQEAFVTYRVLNSNGVEVVPPSIPQPVTLTVVSSLAFVDLDTLDTSGFALGQYSIEVTLTDLSGDPIPGAIGTGTLLVGSPVSANIESSPESLPPGTTTITNTLDISSTVPLVDPLSLVGAAPAPGSTNAIRYGDYVYVASPSGIWLFDVAGPNLNNPMQLDIFGFNTFTMQIHGDMLVAVRGGNSSRLDLYSLADPEHPLHLGTTGEIPYGSASSMVVTDTHVFIVNINIIYWLGSNDLFDHNGSVVAINIENPAAPYLDGDAITNKGTPAGRDGIDDGVLFNDNGTNNDGLKVIGGIDQSGGNQNTWDVKQVSPSILLVTGSSATGTDTQAGVGLVHVVDISDPRNIKLLRDLEIPGTVHAFGLAVDGNKVFVTATEGGFADFTPNLPLSGRIVLATLDISDPANPQLIHTQVQPELASGVTFPTSIGNGLFSYGSNGTDGNSPTLHIVDASDPTQLVVTGIDTTNPRPTPISAGGNLILVTDGNGLLIYDILGTPGVPVTVEVRIPKNTGVTVVPNSFSITPSDVIVGPDFDTYVFNLALGAQNQSRTITWDSVVTQLQPGEKREVTLTSSVHFTSSGSPGEILLPAQSVYAEQILGITPASQTVQPGEAVEYMLSIHNPSSLPVTYDLSVLGVPQDWITLDSQVTVPAGTSVGVPLLLKSNPFALVGDYGIVVNATKDGVTGSVQAMLTLAGAPVLPTAAIAAQGVLLELTPLQATVGQGTSATYVVRVTNTGSQTDTFDLAALGLPPGFGIGFQQTSITVPPGAGNWREVLLTVTAPVGTPINEYLFSVVATSTTAGNIFDEAIASVSVLGLGVDVVFVPSTGSPESNFQLMVTNTGQTTETFDLMVAGPAALAATLTVTQVTLAPGQSQLVPVQIDGVDFAFPGPLQLVGIARSRTNAAVMDAAAANVVIAPFTGLDAYFDPAIVTQPAPAEITLPLFVQNTGNVEQTYSASIIATTGNVTAALIGLDDLPTQSIPTFILPGLGTGIFEVMADVTGFGLATITVGIFDEEGELITQVTATINVPDPNAQGSIRGLSYVDVNNNGQYAAPEHEILGAEILLWQNGVLIARTYSNINGEWHFSDLPAGVYTIQKVQPSLYFDGIDTPGSLGDQDAITNQFTITLPAATDATGYMFAERGLLPWYIGKSAYLASTPSNYWQNLDLRVTPLWYAFNPDDVQLEILINSTTGSVSVEVFDAEMTPLDSPDSINSGAMHYRVSTSETHYLRLSGTSSDVDVSLAFTGLAGDFDGDGDVDGRDFLVWQRGYGSGPAATTSAGDADGDGFVGSSDLAIWQDNYGERGGDSFALSAALASDGAQELFLQSLEAELPSSDTESIQQSSVRSSDFHLELSWAGLSFAFDDSKLFTSDAPRIDTVFNSNQLLFLQTYLWDAWNPLESRLGSMNHINGLINWAMVRDIPRLMDENLHAAADDQLDSAFEELEEACWI